MFCAYDSRPATVAGECLYGVPAFQRWMALELLDLYPEDLKWEMIRFLGDARAEGCLAGAIMVMWQTLLLEEIGDHTVRITFLLPVMP